VSLKLGFEVILRHALKTSTFWSLLAVFGKLDPLHVIMAPKLSVLLRRGIGGPNGEGPVSTIFLNRSDFVLGHSLSSCPASESDVILSLGELKRGSEPLKDGDDDDDEAAGECLFKWCEMGLNDDGVFIKEKSTLLFVFPKYPDNRSSNSWLLLDCGEFAHVDKLFISKL